MQFLDSVSTVIDRVIEKLRRLGCYTFVNPWLPTVFLSCGNGFGCMKSFENFLYCVRSSHEKLPNR